MGLQSDTPIHAVLGESSYLPVDQEKLDKLAGVLVKHPHATIEFVGGYDPNADKAALARARADRAILNAAGFKLSPQEPRRHLKVMTDRVAMCFIKERYPPTSMVGSFLMAIP